MCSLLWVNYTLINASKIFKRSSGQGLGSHCWSLKSSAGPVCVPHGPPSLFAYLHVPRARGGCYLRERRRPWFPNWLQILKVEGGAPCSGNWSSWFSLETDEQKVPEIQEDLSPFHVGNGGSNWLLVQRRKPQGAASSAF